MALQGIFTGGVKIKNLNGFLYATDGIVDVQVLPIQGFVPYVGATQNVNIGLYNITSNSFIKNGGISSQFLKADGSVDSTSYVPTTRTITINNISYDLSSDRSWTIISGVSSVVGTAPISAVNVGGAVTISIPKADISTDGYLSLSDWNTFNSKLSTITGIAAGGELSGTYPNPSLLNSAVINKVLTGLNITGGETILATDTILQAFGKVQNQISALMGGVSYQGVWNASTNNPTLTSSVGTKGYYYVVNVAGSTNLNGITDWKVGDWAIFNGSTWDKVDNTDAVSSVNGFTGAVSLTTSNIPEGSNLYYTDTRARAALTLTTFNDNGAATYNNSTGFLNIPNYSITGLGGVPTSRTLTINGVTYDLSADRTWTITAGVSSVTASSPLLSSGGANPNITIQEANASQNGYLSSTDWSTFKNKQNALTLTTTGISGAATLIGNTLNIPEYQGGTNALLVQEFSYNSSQSFITLENINRILSLSVNGQELSNTQYNFLNNQFTIIDQLELGDYIRIQYLSANTVGINDYYTQHQIDTLFARDWMSLARGYSSIPTKVMDITGGSIWQYKYNSDTITLYRQIVGLDDGFYTTLSGSTVSGLISVKKINYI